MIIKLVLRLVTLMSLMCVYTNYARNNINGIITFGITAIVMVILSIED